MSCLHKDSLPLRAPPPLTRTDADAGQKDDLDSAVLIAVWRRYCGAGLRGSQCCRPTLRTALLCSLGGQRMSMSCPDLLDEEHGPSLLPVWGDVGVGDLSGHGDWTDWEEGEHRARCTGSSEA